MALRRPVVPGRVLMVPGRRPVIAGRSPWAPVRGPVPSGKRTAQGRLTRAGWRRTRQRRSALGHDGICGCAQPPSPAGDCPVQRRTWRCSVWRCSVRSGPRPWNPPRPWNRAGPASCCLASWTAAGPCVTCLSYPQVVHRGCPQGCGGYPQGVGLDARYRVGLGGRGGLVLVLDVHQVALAVGVHGGLVLLPHNRHRRRGADRGGRADREQRPRER